jgi:hypothetical protein
MRFHVVVVSGARKPVISECCVGGNGFLANAPVSGIDRSDWPLTAVLRQIKLSPSESHDYQNHQENSAGNHGDI